MQTDSNKHNDRRDCECHEADRRLTSARKNKHASRNKGKKQSARASASRRNRKAAWTRCASCANTLKRRQRYSASAPTNQGQSSFRLHKAARESLDRPRRVAELVP